MGIDGLLNLLKPITKKQHISTFKNKTIGIDAMPWIYKGCYSCAFDLNQDVESIDFLYYILEMLDLLSYYNIKPIFVFDGRAIEAKGQTLQKRKKNKQQNKQKGLQFLKNNQPQQARKYLSRCIIIDQRILSTTMCALLTKNIQFIVAPYEADCQIAKLRKLGIIDVAISQDSDLVTFGVNVLLKINQTGECDYVDLSMWKPKDVPDIFLKYFLAFDQLTRIDAAVLAGSDYNPSVKGIGIKRAIKLLSKQVTMHNVINKLKNKKQYANKIPENYQNMIERSKLIFNFSTVYNPLTKQLQFLKPELLNELKPETMSLEELQSIVGIHYPYSEDVKCGKIISKTLQQRQLKVLNFRQIFRINKQNLIIHQTLNKQRRRQQQEAKKRLQQQRRQLNGGVFQQENDFFIVDHLNSIRKKARQSVNMTEEQKQKKKQQRKNRIVRLQDMMNTLVDAFGDLQSENEPEEQLFQDQDNQQEFQRNKQFISLKSPHKVFLTNKEEKEKATSQKQDKEQVYVQEQQSNSQDLGFLNPFAKKQMKIISLKHQNLNQSKNKTFK